MKTYNQLMKEIRMEPQVMQDLIDDLPYEGTDLEEFILEGKKGKSFSNLLKVIAVSLQNRLSAQSKRVLSATTTDKKLDELAKSITIAGGISAISVAVSDGGKSGLSKLVGLASIKS
jgi:hypothetical protein